MKFSKFSLLRTIVFVGISSTLLVNFHFEKNAGFMAPRVKPHTQLQYPICGGFGSAPCQHNGILFMCTSVPGKSVMSRSDPQPDKNCLDGNYSWGTCQHGGFLCKCQEESQIVQRNHWLESCPPPPNTRSQKNEARASDQNLSHSVAMFLPPEIIPFLSPMVKNRLQTSAVEQVCAFKELDQAGQAGTCRVNFICDDNCGGIGDRLKGLAGVMIRAKALGCQFMVSMRHPINFLPDILELRKLTPAMDSSWGKLDSSNSSLRVKVRNDYYQSWSFCSWSNYSTINVQANVPGEAYECEADFDLVRNWISRSKGPRVGGMYGCTFWYLFSLGSSLTRFLHQELQDFDTWKIKKGRQRNLVLGVHLRFGDESFGSTSAPKHKILTQRLFGCLAAIETYLGVSDTTIFIASDHLHTKVALQEENPHRVYITSHAPFHVDNIHASVSNSDVMKGTLLSLAEIFLLSFSDGLILSDGGYGNLAAQIGMFPHYAVLNLRDSRCSM
jgi:hypothetical protein